MNMLKNGIKSTTLKTNKHGEIIEIARPCYFYFEGTIEKTQNIAEINNINTPDLPKNRYIIVEDYDKEARTIGNDKGKYLSIPGTKKIGIDCSENLTLWDLVVDQVKKGRQLFRFEVRITTYKGTDDNAYSSLWLNDFEPLEMVD